MKKTKTIILITLLLTQTLFGKVVSSPSDIETESNISCKVTSSEGFFPVSDTGGKTVITKNEVNRECTETKEELGQCTKWEEISEEYSLPEVRYNTYIDEDHSDSMGSLMSMLGSYDQIEHLWSGYKGYCEIGTKGDFEWANDPAFWGGMALSFAMTASSGAEAGNTGSTGAADAVVTKSTASTAETAIEETTSTFFEQVGEVFTSKDAMSDTISEMASTAFEEGTTLTGKAVENATSNYLQHAGKCMIAAGYNTIIAIKTYERMGGNSDEDCDPIDEICGTDPIESTTEEEIMTMDIVDYEDLVAQADVDGYDLSEYIEILSTEYDVVSFRMKRMNEMSPAPESSEEAKDIMKDLQEKMALISIIMNGISTTACLTGAGGYGVQTPMGDDEDKNKIREGVGQISDFAASYAPQPYGAIAALAIKVITQIATSYKDIDSCTKEEDAQDSGSRHLKTWSGLLLGTCHATNKKCVQKKDDFQTAFGSGGCSLWGYEYCCYDQVLSKVLVVQLKSQLGRDFTHCGGISMRDLNYVSFRQCKNPDDTAEENGFDGSLDFYELEEQSISMQEPLFLSGSFQHNQKCVDLSEFIDYLENQMDDTIPSDVIEEYFEDILE